MSPRDMLEAGASALGLAPSNAQIDQLLAYGELILKWNKVYNLTALRDPAQVLTHHLLDSLAAVGPLNRQHPGAGRLLDVGSGGGLPGVVIAILRPDLAVDCLDAVAKKSAFVQQVAAELKLPNLRGVHARVESLTGQYQIISSRAFASLADFIQGSRQLLAEQGVWMAMKGKAPTDELAALPAGIEVFHVEQLAVPGLDAERCIVWMRPIQSSLS
jgi:16S rRNA (guanine527-N7)-methyltransferase